MERKVLVVGCGGIGCELIKCLVLSKITNLTIIDLDTIETSNLNRQFFFSKADVGKAKAFVCREKIGEMFGLDSSEKITAFCSDIFSKEFSVDFFKSFDLVINALDNRTARSHVNKMCVASNVPLIDSGTAGYLGQVHVIMGGITSCYDCNFRTEKSKTYPICTIRNTPSKLIHCIVWAKHVYNCIFFNESSNEIEKNDDDEKDGDFNIISINKFEKNTPSEIIFSYLNKLFNLDICNLLQMEDLWKTRTKPSAIPSNTIQNEINKNDRNKNFVRHYNNHEHSRNLPTWLKLLICSFEQIIARPEKMTWEKDDLDIMAFTASLANLRALQFSIEPDNIFNIKSMAGSIIPAIATTNAIAAALSVVEALKLLDAMSKYSDYNKILQNNRSSYILKDPNHKNQYLISCKLEEKNEDCVVCGHKKETIKFDYKNTTIVEFLNYLNETHKITSPDIYEENTGRLLISSDEDDKSILLSKCTYLSDIKLDEINAFIRVEDFDTEETVYFILINEPGAKLHNVQINPTRIRKRPAKKIEKNQCEILCCSDSDDVAIV